MPKRAAGEPDTGDTVKLTTRIYTADAHAIRMAVTAAGGNGQAWWEQAARWLVAHPEAMTEIAEAMRRELGGKMRRR